MKAPIQRKPEVTLRITRPDGSVTAEAWPVVLREGGGWTIEPFDDRYANCEVYMTIKQGFDLSWGPLTRQKLNNLRATMAAEQ